MKYISCLFLLIISGWVITAAQSLDTPSLAQPSDSLSFFTKIFSSRPLYAQVGRADLFDQRVNITEAQVGFDGELRLGKHAGFEYIYNKSRNRLQYLTFGIGYKSYEEQPNNSFLYWNALLGKLSNQTTVWGGLDFGYNAVVFEKQTNFYSDSEIDWVQAGVEFGGDFFPGSGDIRLIPALFLNIGVTSFKPDTLIFNNLPEDHKYSTAFDMLSGGLRLYASYKPFDLKVELLTKGAGRMSRYSYSGEISYKLWQENTWYYQNNLHAFVRLDLQTIEINKNGMDQSPDIVYTRSIRSIRAGISGRIGKIRQ